MRSRHGIRVERSAGLLTTSLRRARRLGRPETEQAAALASKNATTGWIARGVLQERTTLLAASHLTLTVRSEGVRNIQRVTREFLTQFPFGRQSARM